ncbi:ABC transporter substrate-binding protein [Dactylosporangium vinaceum]|uniref:ABC transporter substrate-binding protein n=1 Tax=Dactylosporangium vinaceum TaxID=53362 RepID=A0ABV5M894_9ACTN|nr:ABC transporter substrate-binding protein [Dactylosporangium vinaceum]UAB92283.1 ABC transporter substrate-binding protein [Dactylosporangium vinaceum]
MRGYIGRYLAGLAAVALLTAGCGGGAAEDPGAAAGAPVTGGKLTWAVETEPVTFNPHQYAQAKARLLVWNSFEALLTHDEKGGYVPWLAKSYEASSDGKAYTFKLRDDVKFHDGDRFDAAAVKANLDQLLVPGYAPGVTSTQLKYYAGAKVVDSSTIEVDLKQPDVGILDFFASPQGAQISPKSLKSPNLKAGGPDVVGTGPFILDRYSKGQEVHYKKNPDYHWAPANAGHQGAAYLDEVTYRFLKESSVRVGALTSQQVDVIEGVPATEQGLVKADPNLQFSQHLNSGTAYNYYFNQTRAPFNDIRVRKAFRDAVDVDGVLQGVYRGTATRAWSILSPSGPYYDASLEKTYGNDPAEAGRLLDEAGWATRDADGFRTKDGARLTVRIVLSAPFVRDKRDILAQAVQAAVKQSAGIDLQVKVVDQGTATDALNKGEFEVFDNSRADTDAGAALTLIVPKGAPINRHGFTSPELDAQVAAGSATSDPAKRKEIYTSIQRTLTDNATLLPLYAPADQIAAQKTVGGLGFEPTAGVPGSAYNVWIGK